MALSAARVTDDHRCPLNTSGVPHVGGPIETGSPNIVICGQKAARVADAAHCEGPTSTVIQGETTVLFNGRPAARCGDATADGGVIIEGCPTVLIGTPGGAPSWIAPNQDVNDLFAVDNLLDLYKQGNHQGAGSKELKNVMNELWDAAGSGEYPEQALEDLARIRGMSVDEAKSQWDRFLQVRDQTNMIGDAAGNDRPQGLAWVHRNFMGSQTQLVFGQVVGSAYGMDPVFGALLSPTGGLVGPGNWSVDLGWRDPIGMHGTVHDAAGFLYNYGHVGPGYDYLNREGGDNGSCLKGQWSGIAFWKVIFSIPRWLL